MLPQQSKSQGSGGGFKGGYSGGDGGFRRNSFRRESPKMNDPNAIYGSVFPDEKTVPLNELNEGMGNVSVKGMVFSLKAIDIKEGRSIISFNIADFTDAISCRIYVDTAESATMQEKLDPGTFVRLTGFISVSNGLKREWSFIVIPR